MSGFGSGFGLDRSVGGLDADAASFIVRAGITDTTQQSAVNKLTTDLKSANLWNKMVALYPFVGGTAAAHAQNLKSSSYTITWVNAPTHNANGVTGNGASAYGITGLAFNILDPMNCHMSVYPRTAAAASDLIGIFDHTHPSPIMCIEAPINAAPQSITMDCNILVDGRMTIGAAPSVGLLINTRRTNADASGYTQGISQVNKVGVVTQSTSALEIWILTRNEIGTPAFPTATNLALSSIGHGLTDTEAANFNTLVQAYQTSLGRAV